MKYISTGINVLDNRLGGGFKGKGAYLLASEKKAGKSSLIRKFIFNMISLGEKVLLMDTEQTEEEIKDAMTAIAKLKDVSDITKEDLEDMKTVFENFICMDCQEMGERFYKEGSIDLKELKTSLKEHVTMGANVIIFDNVTGEGSEGSYKSRMKLMVMLSRIAKTFGILVIVIGHTPSREVETLNKTMIDRVVETRQFSELLNTTLNFVQRPKDPYGGTATSQFDGVFILWRPFQYYASEKLQQVAWLIVEQIRHVAPFNIELKYIGSQHNFIFLKEGVSHDIGSNHGPLWANP